MWITNLYDVVEKFFYSFWNHSASHKYVNSFEFWIGAALFKLCFSDLSNIHNLMYTRDAFQEMEVLTTLWNLSVYVRVAFVLHFCS